MQEEAEETGERNTSDSTNITAREIQCLGGQERNIGQRSRVVCSVYFFFICLSRLCEAKNYYNSTHDRVLRNLHAESLLSSPSSIIGESVHFRTNRSRAACNILEERIISLTCVLFPRPESSTVEADILGISSFWTNCNEKRFV